MRCEGEEALAGAFPGVSSVITYTDVSVRRRGSSLIWVMTEMQLCSDVSAEDKMRYTPE